MNASLPSAAFRVALRGIAVFPLTAGTKIPLAGSHGFHDATTDCNVARAHWAKTPRANIGAATGSRSGIWVFDVDPQHGAAAALAELEAGHGSLPVTIEAATPSGGRHLFWQWDSEAPEIRNSAGRIGHGLDVRGQSLARSLRQPGCRAPPRPSSSMTDGTIVRFGILSIAPQLIHGATEGPPGGPGPVFPAGDLPGLADDDARDPGRLFPRSGIGR